MAISATSNRYDAILLHRQKQAAAAELRDSRSEARRQSAQATIAKSDSLRNAIGNFTAQNNVNQSQLTSQVIRSRVTTEAAERAAPPKWYR